MPVHPYPSFSWSHSRDGTFLLCARKYFWQYYGAHNGWLPESSPEAQLAFVLKHLTALPLVLGITVHQLAREMVIALQRRKPPPSLDALIERTRGELNRAVLSSYHRSAYIQRPTQHQMLHEVWRDGELDAALVDRIRTRMQTCLRGLHGCPIWDELRTCDPSTILVADTMGTFVFEDVTIFAAPDLVYSPTPGNVVVVDWKTGSEYGAELQLPLCALLVRESLGIPFAERSWQGRVINLLTGEETWYDLASADLEMAEYRIRTSVAAMRGYLADVEQNAPRSKDQFPLIASAKRAQAEETGSSLMQEVATVREGVLSASIGRHLPADVNRSAWLAAAVEQAEASREVIGAWWTASTEEKKHNLKQRTPEIAGLVNGFSDRSHDARAIDQTSGIMAASLEDLAREAMQINGREAKHWMPLLVTARRIRGPIAGGISREHVADSQSFLDRPDALNSIISVCALPNLGALVALAHLVLGNVLRDTDLLVCWLERAVQPIERQALVVALGLLGRQVPMELAWPDPSDAEDAAAYLASVALGVDDEGERIDLATTADMRAQGLARDITENALGRIEFGERLGVVE